uniref:Uncharacterized protein n=1 Tax=Phlebotomus kandelakii TaxID=1109342 RepID=A0A6B2EJ21_9DIPT
MPNITVNVTRNPDILLRTLEENIPENSLDGLISALKTIKESSNAYMTELVEQNLQEAPAKSSKTENHTEEEDSEEAEEESGASSPKKAKTDVN